PKVELEADDYYFSPTFLRGRPGQKLTLRVESEASTLHNISIPALGIDRNIPPKGKVEVNVTFPSSGVLAFFCKFHGALGMNGQLLPATPRSAGRASRRRKCATRLVAARVGRHYDASWPGGARGWTPERRWAGRLSPTPTRSTIWRTILPATPRMPRISSRRPTPVPSRRPASSHPEPISKRGCSAFSATPSSVSIAGVATTRRSEASTP